MSKIEQRLPDDWHPDTWSSLDQEQEDDRDVFSGGAMSYIQMARDACVLALFIAMISVWAAIGSGA